MPRLLASRMSISEAPPAIEPRCVRCKTMTSSALEYAADGVKNLSLGYVWVWPTLTPLQLLVQSLHLSLQPCHPCSFPGATRVGTQIAERGQSFDVRVPIDRPIRDVPHEDFFPPLRHGGISMMSFMFQPLRRSAPCSHSSLLEVLPIAAEVVESLMPPLQIPPRPSLLRA